MELRRRDLLTSAAGLPLAQAAQNRPRNVIFILTDDHRYDAMGFLKGQPWLETPNMDRLAREGAHFQNAFVTTALCSPSRASILTGVYAHQHKIVDNNTPIPKGTRFFPQDLQAAGYRTGFFGKWHMGHEGDDPQPGFDQWVSFRGQGTYLPSPNGLNINGRKVPQKGYITDELTDYALQWMDTLPKSQPYFLYLSHKAVHADFEPAPRHKGKYANRQFVRPATMDATGDNARNRPMWCRTRGTPGMAWISLTIPRSRSTSTTNATPRRSVAWTIASGACWTRCRSGVKSIRPWWSTWATTAFSSVSTG